MKLNIDISTEYIFTAYREDYADEIDWIELEDLFYYKDVYVNRITILTR